MFHACLKTKTLKRNQLLFQKPVWFHWWMRWGLKCILVSPTPRIPTQPRNSPSQFTTIGYQMSSSKIEQKIVHKQVFQATTKYQNRQSRDTITYAISPCKSDSCFHETWNYEISVSLSHNKQFIWFDYVYKHSYFQPGGYQHIIFFLFWIGDVSSPVHSYFLLHN